MDNNTAFVNLMNEFPTKANTDMVSALKDLNEGMLSVILSCVSGDEDDVAQAIATMGNHLVNLAATMEVLDTD